MVLRSVEYLNFKPELIDETIPSICRINPLNIPVGVLREALTHEDYNFVCSTLPSSFKPMVQFSVVLSYQNQSSSPLFVIWSSVSDGRQITQTCDV